MNIVHHFSNFSPNQQKPTQELGKTISWTVAGNASWHGRKFI